ncbi:SDR family oxidoreductase [Burkholderia anthina]|uniref:SDR family oxidoreductase n=1 Tax=Burkholderia anthina TaxID=179879 RepID=UPI0037C02B95
MMRAPRLRSRVVRCNVEAQASATRPADPCHAAGDRQPMQATPMTRRCEPRDVAETAMSPCSPAARFVTGQAIAVDGGFTVW